MARPAVLDLGYWTQLAMTNAKRPALLKGLTLTRYNRPQLALRVNKKAVGLDTNAITISGFPNNARRTGFKCASNINSIPPR